MKQVGRAISILADFDAGETLAHLDVDLYNAPSECHGLVSRGELTRRRRAYRHAKSVSGLTSRQFRKVLKNLSCRHYRRAVETILMRDPRYRYA